MHAETATTEPTPAPGEADHVALALANSTYLLPKHGRADLLASPASTRAWLAAVGLAPADADVRELCASRLRELRTHVRALLEAGVDDRPAAPASLDAVNAALTSVPAALLLQYDEESRWHRAAAHPVTQLVDRALAVIAADLADLLAGPDGRLVARCGAPSCERLLLRTHARRTWCSVRCGDRVRAARSYARRSLESDSAPATS
ncbi:CGNR zinc finger domain-containing protein [Nocardioides xinjiangensis]|uniref:CGNR zinc finger domain-containing protein n=1 Tax=Nocardioides xinjiangensis TaxID=2817376 RepID=UPI001B30E342|nr:CGNR zinc finger domain-containing protein [Nocardioides sp. SYSU D00514]